MKYKLDGRLDLVLIKGGDKVRFVFGSQPRRARQLLSSVLNLDRQSFRDLERVMKSVERDTTAFRRAYRKGDGLNFSAIERALVNLKRPAPLADVNVKPFSSAGEYVYVLSSWRASPSKSTPTGKYYYRLRQGVNKRPKAEDTWAIFVWFDIVWVPNSVGKPDAVWNEAYGAGWKYSSDIDEGLADGLTVFESGTKKKVKQPVLATEGKAYETTINGKLEKVRWDAVVEFSTKTSSLLKVSRAVLGRTVEALCDKGRK